VEDAVHAVPDSLSAEANDEVHNGVDAAKSLVVVAAVAFAAVRDKIYRSSCLTGRRLQLSLDHTAKIIPSQYEQSSCNMY
jgi:hypothetical protein